MTKEQAKQLLPVMQAWVDGGALQWKDVNNKWCDTTHLSFVDEYTYRIKPEPKLRPWKPEEVPVGAVTRNKVSGNKSLIAGVAECFVYGYNRYDTAENYLKENEISLDGGKTWLPCGVAE